MLNWLKKKMSIEDAVLEFLQLSAYSSFMEVLKLAKEAEEEDSYLLGIKGNLGDEAEVFLLYCHIWAFSLVCGLESVRNQWGDNAYRKAENLMLAAIKESFLGVVENCFEGIVFDDLYLDFLLSQLKKHQKIRDENRQSLFEFPINAEFVFKEMGWSNHPLEHRFFELRMTIIASSSTEVFWVDNFKNKRLIF